MPIAVTVLMLFLTRLVDDERPVSSRHAGPVLSRARPDQTGVIHGNTRQDDLNCRRRRPVDEQTAREPIFHVAVCHRRRDEPSNERRWLTRGPALD